MEDLEKRAVIKYFNLKGLTTKEIKEEKDSTLNDFTPSYSMVKRWVAEFRMRWASTSNEPSGLYVLWKWQRLKLLKKIIE